ncbi:hypothetical protein ELQ90_12230 [Labedella phragmitis]|uniref:LysM domain-containing protein n=1 Tax=Labedella phragmitis TaxID=2498849 RepID=A0A3S4BGF5_9MICO|nr:hypothetical protein [Labedella phragmitis]RWZ49532.1 hypothetical protein ELQ90_12230 [Labedella phragmitis]
MRIARPAIFALAALLLAGCSGTAVGAQGSDGVGGLSPTPSVTPKAAADRCSPSDEPIPMMDPIDGGRLSADAFAHMRDLGPHEFATGDVTINEEGQPATYTVAPGDVASVVAGRFCISEMELNLLNAVRLCGHGIHPEDVYNLDPYTVSSAGGRATGACDNAITFTLP